MSVTRLAVVGAGLLAVAACFESSIVQVTEQDAVELHVDPDSTDLVIGRELTPQALVLDAAGRLLVGVDVGWTSADPAVATVDENGLVAGLSLGSTQIVATASSLADTTIVVVVEPPALVLSESSVSFSGEAGGANPPADTVAITNGGGSQLAGLSVDSILYGEATQGWLTVTLGAAVAPTGITLLASPGSIPDEGVYTATVWISAADAVDSPASIGVQFDVAPGPVYGDPATVTVVRGGGETAVNGATVETDPTVKVTDDTGSPVPGVTVSFTPSGGGAVGSSTVQTDSNGEASTSWAVSVSGHTMATDGTFQNTLIVSVPGLTAPQLTGFARYSYSADVSPEFGACVGCHGNFVFALSYANLVGVASNCGGTPYPRVSTAGGDAGADASMILLHTRAGLTVPCAFDNHPEFDDAKVDIFEAWIRNSAPNN
ncbi:MAG: Ig-like domain-containing protein [Gemmatimonadota bacterium]